MKMSIIVAILIGAILNGAYVQYKITGTIWGKPQCQLIK